MGSLVWGCIVSSARSSSGADLPASSSASSQVQQEHHFHGSKHHSVPISIYRSPVSLRGGHGECYSRFLPFPADRVEVVLPARGKGPWARGAGRSRAGERGMESEGKKLSPSLLRAAVKAEGLLAPGQRDIRKAFAFQQGKRCQAPEDLWGFFFCRGGRLLLGCLLCSWPWRVGRRDSSSLSYPSSASSLLSVAAASFGLELTEGASASEDASSPATVFSFFATLGEGGRADGK